jgi:YhcH/YjgK/YiaL family protein
VILDTLENRAIYSALHPLFERAFAFLHDTSLGSLAPGRHAIDGDRLFVSIDHVDGRQRGGARLEAHRRYIDIQLTLEGAEEIGWRPVADCHHAAPFDSAKDIGFFDDVPESWVAVPPGHFAIFFPGDAHAPLAGHGRLRKAIVKVEVQPLDRADAGA